MNIFQKIALCLTDKILYEYIGITAPLSYCEEYSYYSESGEDWDLQDLIELRYWLINQKIVYSILLKLLKYLKFPINRENTQFLRDYLYLPDPDDYQCLMACDGIFIGQGLRGTEGIQKFLYHAANWTVHEFHMDIDSWSEFEELEVLKQLPSSVPRSTWKPCLKAVKSIVSDYGFGSYTFVLLHYTSKIDMADITNIYSGLAFFALHLEKERLLLYIIPQEFTGVVDECFDFSSMDPYGAFYAFYKGLKEPLLLPDLEHVTADSRA